MTIDLDSLESAAKAATPGPWETIGYRIYADKRNVANAQEVYSYNEEEEIPPKEAEANATYLAAVSPDVVLRMLAEIRKLRAELEYVRELHAEVSAALLDAMLAGNELMEFMQKQ